jgi:type I restriction enzyme R subunit
MDKVKSNNQKEVVSILDDVDFELELIHRDEINVAYILRLLASLKTADESDYDKQKQQILDTLSSEASLRSKRELIEKFIEENLPHIDKDADMTEEFERFISAESQRALDELCKTEDLNMVKLEKLIDNYLYSGRKPINDEALELLNGLQPKLLQRRPVGNRIINKILNFVETFINGMA